MVCRKGGGHLTARYVLVWTYVVCSLQASTVNSSQESPQQTADHAPTQRPNTREVTTKLLDAFQELKQELAQQRRRLHTVGTDRERQLIQAHIEFLEKEQRALQQLLSLLAESQSDIRQTGLEQQQELWEDRLQQQLERRQQVLPRR